MGKNLIPIIVKELGVEIGEEFKTNHCRGTFRFTENCLEWKYDGEIGTNGQWETCRGGVGDIVCGEAKVIKLPFNPEKGERYWSLGAWWQVDWYEWDETPFDYMHKAFGCIFRTESEAIEARPDIYKRLTGKDWDKRGEVNA